MFDIFEQSETSRTLESYEYVEYLEEGGGASAGQLSGKTTDMRIRMTDRDLVTLPADSFVQAIYEVAQDDGSPADQGTPFTTGKIAPVNGGWNLFRRAKYLLSNEVAEDIYRPGYVRQVKGLIEYSDDFERGQGQMELWIPDRYNGVIDEETVGLSAYNATQGYVIPSSAISFSGNNPHVVSIVDEGGNVLANNDLIDFYFAGEKLDVIVETHQLTEADPNVIVRNYIKTQLLAVVPNGTLDFAEAVPRTASLRQFVYFQLHGSDVHIGKSTLPDAYGYFEVNATPVITFINGEGVAGVGAIVTNIDKMGIYQNTGFEKRRAKLASDKRVLSTTDNSISLFMPLRRLFPLLKQNPIIMRGIEQELCFDLNDFKSVLYRDANVDGNADGRIILRRLSWWVPVLRPTLQIKNEINKMLNSGEKRVLKWDATNHYYSEPRNSQESSWLIKTSEHRPVRCYVFFQQSSKFANQTENNMIFDNYDVNRIFLRINSDRQFPNKEYRVNYEVGKNQDYARVYSAYLSACMAVHSDDCKPAISYDEFRDLYPLYYFDLSHQDESVWDSTTQAHITVEYSLNSTPSQQGLGDYRIHAVLDTEREITLQGINGRFTRVK